MRNNAHAMFLTAVEVIGAAEHGAPYEPKSVKKAPGGEYY
jgi:hypothetical protein